MEEYLDLSLASFILTVVRSVVALSMLWVLLRFFDRAVDFSFSRWMKQVGGGDGGGDDGEGGGEGNPTAVAMYLGARFIGACLLFGLLFS